MNILRDKILAVHYYMISIFPLLRFSNSIYFNEIRITPSSYTFDLPIKSILTVIFIIVSNKKFIIANLLNTETTVLNTCQVSMNLSECQPFSRPFSINENPKIQHPIDYIRDSKKTCLPQAVHGISNELAKWTEKIFTSILMKMDYNYPLHLKWDRKSSEEVFHLTYWKVSERIRQSTQFPPRIDFRI